MATQVAQYRQIDAGRNGGNAGNADALGADARALLPPPGIAPNNAVFGGVNLSKPLTWQRREHLVQRRNILGRVGQLLKRNAQLVMSGATAPAAATAHAQASETSNAESHAKTWALARKLEVLLFLNSASLLEYSNADSLARRVQALTTSIVNKKIRREIVNQSGCGGAGRGGSSGISAAGSPIVAARNSLATACAAPTPSHGAVAPRIVMRTFATDTAAPPLVPIVPPVPAAILPATLTSKAADLVSSPSSGVLPSIGYLIPSKRRADAMRTADVMTTDVLPSSNRGRCAKRARRTPPTPIGVLLFRGFEEISKIIWSFVDGVQIMQVRAVSRAARVLAPLFVTSLQVSCNGIQRALSTGVSTGTGMGGCVLRECVNLKQLEVVALASGMTFGKLSMRAMNCPQRFVVTHDDHEQIVLALSEQLRSNAFPRLTRLGLTCLFTNEEADGEADVLLNNLMAGCCPQLEELCLPGNSFGDYGAMKIAQMLRARVCPKLTRLDLRRNFISEEGVRSLCHALADGCAPDLVELCLGGNTITDSCFHHVLFAMESRQLQQLRFLGIEMNYLTSTSMEMLGRTIGKMVCPVLSQISYSDNSVDNADAKRLIATAVYQERMFRLRQQQLKRQQRLNGQKQQQRHKLQQLHEEQFCTGLSATGATPLGGPTRPVTPGSTRSSEWSGNGSHFSSGEDDVDEAYSSDGE